MAGIGNFWEYEEDFISIGTLDVVGQGDPWAIADDSSAGTPTYARVDHGSGSGAPGVVNLSFDSQTEAQNVCLYHNDVLWMDIDLLQGIEIRLQMGQATADATTSLAFGVTGDRNDAIDSIAQAAIFRVVGADDTTAVVVETDDGTNDNNDVATGQVLVAAYKRFKIDFSNGTTDVRFFMDNGNGTMVRVAAATTFDMSNYSGALQPFFQIQKTSDSNVDDVDIDYFKAWGIRQAV